MSIGHNDHNGVTSSGGSGMQGAPSLIRSQLLWSISTGSCKVANRDIFPLFSATNLFQDDIGSLSGPGHGGLD